MRVLWLAADGSQITRSECLICTSIRVRNDSQHLTRANRRFNGSVDHPRLISLNHRYCVPWELDFALSEYGVQRPREGAEASDGRAKARNFLDILCPVLQHSRMHASHNLLVLVQVPIEGERMVRVTRHTASISSTTCSTNEKNLSSLITTRRISHSQRDSTALTG